jgi:hypothetical protein
MVGGSFLGGELVASYVSSGFDAEDVCGAEKQSWFRVEIEGSQQRIT